jgi:hypothetical protein
MSEEVLIVKVSESKPCIQSFSLRLVYIYDETGYLMAK